MSRFVPLLLSSSSIVADELGQDINRLIPRSEMDLLRSALESAVAFADGRFESSILGSYRRGVPFSSDIDLVIRHELFIDADDAEVSKPLMFKIIQSLTEAGLVKEEDALTRGPKKYSVRAATP
jgi:DNA polymerase/3'-5' exonuclease PolX